jgi:prophage regulatory protein
MRLIRIKEVMKLTGISRAYVYVLAHKGEFPAPVKLTERSSAWVEEEVKQWIESRIQERNKVHSDLGQE